VAQSGRLPPPLAAALVKGIDRYEWLRDQALERFPDDGEPVARDILERSPGWTVRLAEAVARSAAATESGRSEDLAARAEALERDLGEARRRLKRQQKDFAAERDALAARLDEARAPARAERDTVARAEAAADRRIREARDDLARARAEADELRAEVRRLREDATEERRRRVAAEHALAESAAPSGWTAGDAVALAVHLDHLAAMARPEAPGTDEPVRSDRPPLRLPAVVAPDTADALDWVLARREPTTVIVDGYNAGYALTGGGDPAAARLRLGLEVERLPVLAAGAMKVVVVYDSTVESDEPDHDGVVAVRFAAPDTSADDDIVALVRAGSGDTVVITGDRAVREAVEAAGALALWSAALVAWARRR
jgi:hypothetical protein